VRLEDIASGDVKIGSGAAVSYNGQVYRGKELKELLAKHKNDLTTEEIQGDSATSPDSENSKSAGKSTAGK
jgi:hypothetical protein